MYSMNVFEKMLTEDNLKTRNIENSVNINCNYYDVADSYNNFSNRNEILLTHLNVRSFNRNYEVLIAFVNKLNLMVQVICFTENWFKQDIIAGNHKIQFVHVEMKIRLEAVS